MCVCVRVLALRLAANRDGHVSERLFEYAKEAEKKRAEKSLESRREAAATSRPVVSGGTERIVAELPGREGPVQ